ncbi:hypothetical protein HDV06_000933 [Boothiomyces sp. JEL0866]|nr:hypothetical protein HDV06_000933 [Boothiomyces sp. JEL0866]
MDTIDNLQLNQLEGTEEQRQLDSFVPSLKLTTNPHSMNWLTKDDWEKFCGPPGFDIYNHLHPKHENRLTEGQKGRFIELCVWIYSFVEFFVFVLAFVSEAVAGHLEFHPTPVSKSSLSSVLSKDSLKEQENTLKRRKVRMSD